MAACRRLSEKPVVVHLMTHTLADIPDQMPLCEERDEHSFDDIIASMYSP
jgi:hypothetical protein